MYVSICIFAGKMIIEYVDEGCNFSTLRPSLITQGDTWIRVFGDLSQVTMGMLPFLLGWKGQAEGRSST
jgi:hypothetical protein